MSAGGLPLGFDTAGFLKSEPSDPSQLPEELRPLRTDLLGLELRLAFERPGGLPRRAVPHAEEAPRLVLAYCRVFIFPFGLRCLVLEVSVISLGL